MNRCPRHALPIVLFSLLSVPSHADDSLHGEGLRWQARVQLTSSQPEGQLGTRLLSANLLGDYYLTGPLWGGHQQGGLRATGGVLLGAMAWSQSSAGLALAPGTPAQRQSLSVGNPYGLQDSTSSASYLGLGYTGQSLQGGWGFSADVGLMRPNTSSLRLGKAGAPNLDEWLGDMRLRPVVQLGLSYRF